MKNLIMILQIIVSVLLIVLILIQTKGSGLARSFGGGTSFSRRGVEKLLYKATFVIVGLFILFSLISLVI